MTHSLVLNLVVSGSAFAAARIVLEAIRRQLEGPLPSSLDQIPYVVALMVFAFWYQREHRADRKEERETWQAFLKEHRERHSEALARIAEEVKTASIKSSETLSRVATVLDAHDRRSEAFTADQARQVHDLAARVDAVYAVATQIDQSIRSE